ncbi:MAG: hypothetical protein IIZ93_05045 [Acidaminococcaceae bacterium]|nr:hypothetical protein [Acidaminococcaceae bacterium]
MANTTNLDLVKPAGTDHALISVLNSNSDKIDAFAGQTNDSLSAEQNGLAYIVGNTNTTGGTLAVGQFVYVKGHSTIPEGLRKVTSSISANGSITTSNTDAVSGGGLNELNSKIKIQEVASETTVMNLYNAMENSSEKTFYGNSASLFTDISTTLGEYAYYVFIHIQKKSYGTVCVYAMSNGAAWRRFDFGIFGSLIPCL